MAEEFDGALVDADGAEPEAAVLAEAEAQEEASAVVELAGLRQELAAERERTLAAVRRYRDALLSAEPELPAELVAGETLEALDVAVASARRAVAQIREQLGAGAGAVVVVDDNLTTQPRASARAAGVLRRAALDAPRGELVCAPHVGLEVGDVIAVTDAQLGLAAARFRVAALRLRYARGGARPRYEQTLTLSVV